MKELKPKHAARRVRKAKPKSKASQVEQWILDMFCGAGGSTSGIREAVQEKGLKVRYIAINHWNVAIDTHSENFPDATHLCQNVDRTDPLQVVPGGRLELLWASPSCVHHSRARGGRPVNDQQRMSAFTILEWAHVLYIKNIVIENVPDFITWGSLNADKRPNKKLKGQMFLQFLKMLEAENYNVDWRILNCANYGDPTTRERLFIIARKKPLKIRWPEPTHSRPMESDQQNMFGTLQPWHTAREIIDWGDLGTNIFDRRKPLSPNTMRRIYAGLEKFCGISLSNIPGSQAALQVSQLPVVAGGSQEAPDAATPFVLPNEGVYRGNQARSTDDPMPTVTSRGAGYVVRPFILNNRGGEDGYLRGSSVEDPMQAVTAHNPMELVTPYLIEYHGGKDADDRVRPVSEPLRTQDTSNRFGLVQPYVVQLEHSGANGKQVRSVDEPVQTVTGNARFAVVQPFVLGQQSGSAPRSVDEPVPTVAAKGAIRLIEPYIVATEHATEDEHESRRAFSTNRPLPTVTSKPMFHLVRPYLVEMYGTGTVRSVDEPLSAVTASGNHHALVIPQLDGKALLIFMRMLKVRELARAQGFPDDYVFKGNQEQQKKMIGNAVPRGTARALCSVVLDG